MSRTRPQIDAVIPAAGMSRRMGRPKLSLPLGTRTVLEHVLMAVQRPRLRSTVVVLGPASTKLAPLVLPPAVALCLPADTPDMRTTVFAGLTYLRSNHTLSDSDAFLLALGDQPGTKAELVDRLIEAYESHRGRIIVPTFNGKRGHPVLFPWLVMAELTELPPDCGLNELLRRDPQRVVELATDDEAVLEDLDDPDDYARHQDRHWT